MREETVERTKTNISRRMKVRLFELGMTIRELSRKSGVPAPSICSYVAMRNMMSADALAAIAEGLECSADWLLGISSEKTRK